MNSSEDPNAERLAVYYDGACPLCRREIGVYKSCTGAEAMAWVDVSAGDGSLPSDLDREAALARFHVRLPDGRLVSGAEAFGRLWSALPRWRWLGRIVLLPGIRAVAEFAYRRFLKVRPAVQGIVRRRERAGVSPKMDA